MSSLNVFFFASAHSYFCVLSHGIEPILITVSDTVYIHGGIMYLAVGLRVNLRIELTIVHYDPLSERDAKQPGALGRWSYLV